MDNIQYNIGENEQSLYIFIITADSVQKQISCTFVLESNAFLRVEIICAHTDAVIAITCILRGQASEAIINGAYVLHETNQVRVSTVQHHEAAYTKSSLIMRSIIDDQAILSYSGMIRVEKQARCSVSSQENKNMLLSDAARAVSIPSLEVLTHDVRCFHGSATARPDQESLFYGASRGIDEKQMIALLGKAFFADMFKNSDAIALLEGLV